MKTRIILTFTLVPLLFFIMAAHVNGKSWRQITPLRSTAKDAARMFQACEKSETRCQFTLEDQEVMIVFSGSAIGRPASTIDVAECKQVPKQTVLAVIITFKAPKELRGFKVTKKQFRTFDPSSPAGAGYKTYYDAQDGFTGCPFFR